ncbi:MAG: DUF3520 domain-containing protein [Clostridiales bacterium]|nr:DUF3520 domain-containing protein [Clostridiales bacterium]
MKHGLTKAISILLTLMLTVGLMLPGLAAADSKTKELQRGDFGEDVRTMQRRLQELGYYTGAVSGQFDEETEAALMDFQQQNNLLESGILDEITRNLLFSDAAEAADHQLDQTREGAMEAPTGYFPSFAPYADLDFNTTEYSHFQENRFLSVLTSPLSTFAADVDTASYAQLRRMILSGESIPVDSVRVEEMLNYFRYDYKGPSGDEPFGVTMELMPTPWNAQTQLMLIGLQAKEIKKEERPAQNLVFLIDISGSMESPNKLPLAKRAFLMLLDELSPHDTISVVTYASGDEVVLEGVKASEKTAIMAAISGLTSGGFTAGAAGITTAYDIARKYYVKDGNNRVLLATDGDLNVGITDEGALARLVQEQKQGGIFLSVLGFGMGNYKDNKLEALANHGDGNYSYIDTIFEARKALVEEIGATFFAVAKDVKLQVDFNPQHIKGYRLIGYENRLMNAEDFADDSKDGGELGSGHRLTVLYELVQADSEFDLGEASSKYQAAPEAAKVSPEWLTLSIRAKAPDGDESALYTYPLILGEDTADTANLRFAAAIAQVGMLLRDSEWKGTSSYAGALDLLREEAGVTGDPYKEEFLYLVTLLARQQQDGQ